MKIIETEILSLEQKLALFDLWNSQYPEKIGYREISEFEVYLKGLEETNHLLLADELNQIFGWAFSFVREQEDWFGIIVNSKNKGKGFGTLLLKELKNKKPSLNGWVIDNSNNVKQNGEMYWSPIDFYFKNGFSVDKNIRMENDKISAVKIRWKRE